MERWRPIEIFALYVLAAASCTDTPGERDGGTPAGAGGHGGSRSEAGHAPAADGGGGRPAPVAGAGGFGGRPAQGEECTSDGAPPAPFDPKNKICSGAIMEWDGCKQRHEDVQCYVAELKDGHPDCLPDSDPAVVGRLVDFIHSNGFGAEFVLEAAPDMMLPAGCDDVVACCEQLTVSYEQSACFDALDDTHHGAIDCSTFSTRPPPFGGTTWGDSCPALKAKSSDEDAGPPEPTHYGLCCYRACGHTIDT